MDQVLKRASCDVQAAGGDESQAAGINAWLRAREVQHLAQLLKAGNGSVHLVLDGQPVQLKLGEHFTLPK